MWRTIFSGGERVSAEELRKEQKGNPVLRKEKEQTLEILTSRTFSS